MSSAAAPAPLPVVAAASPRPRAFVVRLLAVGALAAFGAQAWGSMVVPETPDRVVGAAVVGCALAAAFAGAMHAARWARLAVLVALPFAAAGCALLLAGVPLHLLDLESWGDLAAGLGQGIQALPGLNVPYRGIEEWNRIAMLLGGTVAAIVGVMLACRPLGHGRYARPLPGVVLLSVLYAVPAVQLDLESPFGQGVVFALLLAGALWGERLAAREAPIAGVAVLLASLVALAFAPALDSDEPWLDYESIAQSLGTRGTSAFSWNHEYGPLDWPRDGREVLRIRAETASYWKATTLAEFDGRRWVEVRPQGLEDDPEAATPRERWLQDLRVSIRNLRTQQFISAGTTLRIERSPRTVLPGAPGSFVTSERPLRRGHAYMARAYIPRPRALQLETASDVYPPGLWPFLSIRLPASMGGPAAVDALTQEPDPDGRAAAVVFSPWGDGRPALGYLGGRGVGVRVGSDWVRDSVYARTYALARRLARESTSAYAYVRAVQRHLSEGFTYSETPPERPVPLDAFLFRDRVGYCQQFSGAMALLLRMGGVPARVATGFSPGTLDRERGEYVVRDLDAHSWVEAYFPGYGWVPFDPTPAIAPARAQLPALDLPGEESSEELGSASASRGSERAGDPRALGRGEAADEGGSSAWPLLLGIAGGLVLLAGAAYALLAVRWRRRYGPEAAAAELARALRRTGRAVRPGTTLAQIEESLRWAPDAAAFVSTVRSARFGFGAAAPTREQRKALRRSLASGLGLRGRLRALWALPPF
ncbi:MAG TPA: transglutaminaseTgpA domain-containing protein [Solirubrobacteraceae bacterium]|nr:transglutaminaseTgpA domain-containing protein [Solirubrobacteraceae bacterium]